MSLQNASPQKIAVVKMVTLMTGFFFIIASSYILADIESVHELSGIDSETLSILAYAFIMVGVSDLIISLFIFRKKERK